MMESMVPSFELPSGESFLPYAISVMRIVVILLTAFALSWLVRNAVRKTQQRVKHVMESHGDMGHEAISKRTDTIGGILRGVASVVIWAIAVIMCLREAGFDVTPMLAGAGVAGVAVGFGAQSLVRDVISGAFMLLEDQIRLGDVVKINGTGGLVEEINLRTTLLRAADGSVHIFQNGGISTLSNLTRDYAYYVFEIGVAYKEDTDRVVEVLVEVAAAMAAVPEYADLILDPLEIQGVDRFEASAVIIRSRIKTKPIKQWAVGRELNRRFKKRFDELGIEIPYPHMSLYFGEASKPVQIDSPGREELRQAVRDVLAE
jgi:moderate conductance mechanosensitive channel